MNELDPKLIEKARAGELAALGSLLNREASIHQLTLDELVQRYEHMGLTREIALRACNEDHFLSCLKKARECRCYLRS